MHLWASSTFVNWALCCHVRPISFPNLSVICHASFYNYTTFLNAWVHLNNPAVYLFALPFPFYVSNSFVFFFKKKYNLVCSSISTICHHNHFFKQVLTLQFFFPFFSLYKQTLDTCMTYVSSFI